MAQRYLRVYHGPEEATAEAACGSAASTPPSVNVTVAEVLPLLADALASNRTWLHDFYDDPVTISADLYEVLLAYQYYRRPGA